MVISLLIFIFYTYRSLHTQSINNLKNKKKHNTRSLRHITQTLPAYSKIIFEKTMRSDKLSSYKVAIAVIHLQAFISQNCMIRRFGLLLMVGSVFKKSFA